MSERATNTWRLPRVKWAHHPPDVKAAIRRAGFIPRIKQCFANCQRVVLFGELDGAAYSRRHRESGQRQRL